MSVTTGPELTRILSIKIFCVFIKCAIIGIRRNRFVSRQVRLSRDNGKRINKYRDRMSCTIMMTEWPVEQVK